MNLKRKHLSTLLTWKNIQSLLLISLILLSFSVYMIPVVSFSVGNLFFGKIDQLYNVDLAQIFYKRSIESIFSTTPPKHAHYQLSRTYFIQGDLFSALEEAKEELKLYPESTKSYYILGLIYGYLGQEKKGIESFEHYIQTHPDTWAGRNDRAWLQFRIGDIKGAVATLSPIIETQTNNVWIQNTYCALMINTGELQKAKKACKNAKEAIQLMTPESWGVAYPGNDPRIYESGLKATKKSIDDNLTLIEKEINSYKK